MPSAFKRFLWPIILLLLGSVVALWAFPMEVAQVKEHLIGYPDADRTAHAIRPWLLLILCYLPCLAAILYSLSSTLDRYMAKELLGSFGICFTALVGMLFLLEIQNTASNFKDVPLYQAAKFYLVQFPSMLMMILPYSLMLSLLWCLGKLSKSQEIVSMLQSGRSVTRILLPLIVAGTFLTIATTIFSYHWSPNGEAYKDSMISELKGDKNIAASNVGHYNPAYKRMWFVSRFPRDFAKGADLDKVFITQYNENGDRVSSYTAETAAWKESSNEWLLTGVLKWTHLDSNGEDLDFAKGERLPELTMQWAETPWQLIRPGLDPANLGIPDLNSWLANNPQSPLDFRRAYQTWWHFRWAQPVICLVIVLLAAPLGIAFTRRGVGGGVAVAIFLCAGMLFCSTVFPTLGESGHLPPMLAAWATNIVFLSVAGVLLYRRASGQPIYQTLRKFLPF